jgi:hypothetical protein
MENFTSVQDKRMLLSADECELNGFSGEYSGEKVPNGGLFIKGGGYYYNEPRQTQ